MTSTRDGSAFSDSNCANTTKQALRLAFCKKLHCHLTKRSHTVQK